ncbi:hypothetical protein KFL_004070050 [Klebsormidium nitens]|uniref:Leucine-rich repeat-containing N-terminal plant-type domain-containing protein n=1 Tax=Klebsormidium nitens TaxID=105231 RepID=A0A1Y1IC76_KLENI|nr:hypothetical protein KFL_004070050 [Klebsormidium nitens]|eukprot:GAQ88183.1 hypothetical protein KFL_004070050 [Klebsormidium nitens]
MDGFKHVDLRSKWLWALVLAVVGLPVATAQVTQAEVSALAQFRSFIVDPYNHLASWAGENPCLYQGVACGGIEAGAFGATDAVSEINLSNLNLTGTISPALLNVTNLKILNVSHNYFYGPMPTGLQNLTSLSIIDMSYNNLDGTVPLGLLLKSGVTLLVNDNPSLCDPRITSCENPPDGPLPQTFSHGDDGLSGGAIFGIIVAILLIGGAAAGGAFYYLKVHRKKKQSSLNFERFTGMGVAEGEQY